MKASVEFLYHFSCDACHKWWSVGDFEWEERKPITCPHCGHVERLPDNPLLLKGFKVDTNPLRQQITDAGFSNLYESLPDGQIRAVPEGWTF